MLGLLQRRQQAVTHRLLVGDFQRVLQQPVNRLRGVMAGDFGVRVGPLLGPAVAGERGCFGGGCVVAQQQFPGQPNRQQMHDLVVVRATQPGLPALKSAPSGPAVDAQQQGAQVVRAGGGGDGQRLQRVGDEQQRIGGKCSDARDHRALAAEPGQALVGGDLALPGGEQTGAPVHAPARLTRVKKRGAVLADLVRGNVAPGQRCGGQQRLHALGDQRQGAQRRLGRLHGGHEFAGVERAAVALDRGLQMFGLEPTGDPVVGDVRARHGEPGARECAERGGGLRR